MTLIYFCDVDTHLKENFRNQDIGHDIIRDTSGVRTLDLAFRSRSNLSSASYSRRAKGVPSLSVTFYSYHYGLEI